MTSWRYTSKRKQSLIVDRTKVDVMASELFWRSVYGEDHPYGRSSSEDGYDTLTGDMLRRFFRDHYNLENSFTVVSGKIEPGFMSAYRRLWTDFRTARGLSTVYRLRILFGWLRRISRTPYRRRYVWGGCFSKRSSRLCYHAGGIYGSRRIFQFPVGSESAGG